MDYKLYQSQLIKDNHELFINECGYAYTRFKQIFNSKDSTWNYNKYNIFNLTSSSILFYKLYKELNYHIRSFIGDNKPLWIASWLNYHSYSNIEKELPFHDHGNSYCHGYISISPQNTTTEFKNGLKINNKIGQIYLGPDSKGYNHRVINNSYYSSPRITIGFNIENNSNSILHEGFIPLL